MSSAEFSEWLAWDRIGGLVDLNQAQAQICQVLAGSLGGVKGRGLEDYLLLARERPEAERLSPTETAGVLGRLAAERAGGKAL